MAYTEYLLKIQRATGGLKICTVDVKADVKDASSNDMKRNPSRPEKKEITSLPELKETLLNILHFENLSR